MLAAPVVNPVVLLSTLVAFQGNWTVAALRMGMTLSVAIAVGLAASILLPAAGGLQPSFPPVRGGAEPLPRPLPETGRDATPPRDGEGPGEGLAARPRRIVDIFAHANAEFFDVMFFIVLGALFTAATQTIVPRGDLAAVGAHPLGSILTLMPVATMLSICSEADAFVARAFANTFTPGAVLAFMTIGQVIDLRNGFLLLRTVGVQLLALIAAISYVLVLAEALAVNAAFRSL
jgi:uncharacterized protein